jgi:hypothetical protein
MVTETPMNPWLPSRFCNPYKTKLQYLSDFIAKTCTQIKIVPACLFFCLLSHFVDRRVVPL